MVFDIFLLVLLGLFAWAGNKKGLIRSAIGLLSVVISYVASMILFAPISQAFKQTPVYEIIFEKVKSVKPESIESLHKIFGGDTVDIVAEKATMFISNIIISALIFVVVMVVINVIASLLNSIFRLPGLNFLNKMGGLILGTISGFLVCYVVIAIWGVCTLFKLPDALETSTLVRSMFENNLLFLLIS